MTDEEYQRELEEAERLQRQINNVIDQIIAIINSPIHMICLSFIFCLLIGVQILSEPL